MKRMIVGGISEFRRDERGAVTILFALGSTIFILLAGFAIDLGIVFSTQAQMRGTADATALAAASSLTNLSTARSRALTVAEQNMPAATHGTVLNSNDIDIGNWNTGTRTFTENGVPTNAVRTVVRRTAASSNPVNLFFGRIIDKNTADVTVTAIALEPVSGTACVLALAPTATGALEVSGNAIITFNGCNVAANSNDDDALKASNNASLTANCASVVGGSSATSPQVNLACGSVATNSRSLSDPYSALPSPSPTACPPGTNQFRNTSGTTILSPGTFCGNFDVTGGTVQLQSGTYIIDKGNFKVNGGATLEEVAGGTGVTIILTDSSGDSPGQVTINGGATINLAAPTSGDYAGIVFFQDKNAEQLSGTPHKFNGGSTMIITGALYFPAEQVEFTGGSQVGGSVCTQIVAGTIKFGGNATLNSTCAGTGTTSINVVGRTYLAF